MKYIIAAVVLTAIEAAAIVCIAWLLGSFVTSAIKTHQRDCKLTYNIEEVLQADWFCPAYKL